MGNKALIIIVAVLLFGAYPITWLCYNDLWKQFPDIVTDIWNAWYLNLIFAALSVSLYVNHRFINNFWTSLIFNLSVANLVDAIAFDVFEYTFSDIILILFSILSAHYGVLIRFFKLLISYFKHVCQKD